MTEAGRLSSEGQRGGAAKVDEVDPDGYICKGGRLLNSEDVEGRDGLRAGMGRPCISDGGSTGKSDSAERSPAVLSAARGGSVVMPPADTL